MNNEQQEVAALIRNGKYFEEARSWYQALYIGPISERMFFLIISALAGLVSLFGVVAFLTLLPVTTHPAIMLDVGQPELRVPSIERIRTVRGQPLDIAMAQFLIGNYIEWRESYAAQDYALDTVFVMAHSSPPVLADYVNLYGKGNPRSPVNVLGAGGERIATIKSLVLNPPAKTNADGTAPADPDLRIATVKFSTELNGMNNDVKTQWTATVGYHYSPLKITDVKDPATGEIKQTVEDPQFQVVNYAVSQTP